MVDWIGRCDIDHGVPNRLFATPFIIFGCHTPALPTLLFPPHSPPTTTSPVLSCALGRKNKIYLGEYQNEVELRIRKKEEEEPSQRVQAVLHTFPLLTHFYFSLDHGRIF